MIKKKQNFFFFVFQMCSLKVKQTNKQNIIIPASLKARNWWQYKDLRKMIEFSVMG